MLLPATPLIYRKRKNLRRPRRRAVAPPGVALTLVWAVYSEALWVRLTFDRAIDIASLDATQIIVNDGPLSASRWRGAGAGVLVEPTIVQIALTEVEPIAESEVTLDATAASGIVAQDDGGTWAGVSDYPVEA